MHAILIPLRSDDLTEDYNVEMADSLSEAQTIAAQHKGAKVLTGEQLEQFLQLGPDYLATL